MKLVAKPETWICRSCGLVNRFPSDGCEECSTPVTRESRFKPDLEQLQRADRALTDWIDECAPEETVSVRTAAPPPSRSFAHRAIMSGAAVLVWLGIIVVTSVTLFLVIVFIKAFTGHG